MQHMRDAAAQHQCGEGASHPRQIRVAPALRMNPAIERIQHDGGGAPHFHGLGQIAKSIEEAAHRDLGRLAAAFGAADAVRDRRHHVAARLGQFGAENGAGKIFVAFARSGLRDEPDACLDAGNPLSHAPLRSVRKSARLPRMAAGSVGRSRPQFLQLATMIEERAAGARREDHRKSPGFAVKRVVAAVARVAPRNLRVADAGRIGIHGSLVVVDPDLPVRAAGHIGAGHRGRAMLRCSADRERSRRWLPPTRQCPQPVAVRSIRSHRCTPRLPIFMQMPDFLIIPVLAPATGCTGKLIALNVRVRSGQLV